jgi:hypothetical protein
MSGTITVDQFSALTNLMYVLVSEDHPDITAAEIGDILYFDAYPISDDQALLLARAITAYLGLRFEGEHADVFNRLVREVDAEMKAGKGTIARLEDEEEELRQMTAEGRDVDG